jgi:hypothetical protein
MFKQSIENNQRHAKKSKENILLNAIQLWYCLRSLGALAQLGERLHGMQEVVGSIPIGSILEF